MKAVEWGKHLSRHEWGAPGKTLRQEEGRVWAWGDRGACRAAGRAARMGGSALLGCDGKQECGGDAGSLEDLRQKGGLAC